MALTDKTPGKEFLVGAFVTAGLIVLVLFVASLGGLRDWIAPQRQVTVKFDRLGGLKVGQPVRYSGHPVGRVSSINLTGDSTPSLLVTLSVDREVPFYQNSRVVITSSGLIGDKVVDVFPPRNPDRPATADDVLDGEEPVSLSRVLKDLSAFTGTGTGSNLRSILDNANQTSRNLAKMSKSLRTLVANNKGRVNTTLSDLSDSSRKLKEALERADTTARSLEELTGKLTSITDKNRQDIEKIISNLTEASRSLKKTGRDLEDDPSSLLWGK